MAAFTRLACLFIIFWLLPLNLYGQSGLIDNGSYLLSKDDQILESHNVHQPFIPASTIKIFTGLLALDSLGKDYRFTTLFYLDQEQNLWIKGGGDPFLTSENVNNIAIQLKKLGIHRVDDLILDDSLYQLEHPVNGSEQSLNPYDTENGALAVNFNALPIVVEKGGKVFSSEPQTPTLPIMQKLGKMLPPGVHRVNVCAKDFLQQIEKPPLQYTGELFAALLKRNQISVEGDIKFDMFSGNTEPFFVYQSEKTVEEMLKACFIWSNNYVANQLFLQSGMMIFGTPANWKKSIRYTNQYLQKHFKFTEASPVIIEGSGLSRANQISAAQMLLILKRFLPFAKTLLPKKQGVLVKSGTLSNVYCYIGYIPDKDTLYPFIIYLNQEKNTRDIILNSFKNSVSKPE